MKNRIKCFFTIVLLTVFLLVSCSAHNPSIDREPEKHPEPQTSVETEEEALPNQYDAILSKRVERDFNGKSFRIATDNIDFILSNNGESLLGKEHYLRNSAIEKKYNIKISLTEESGLPTVADRIRSEALAGTDYCDLVILESAIFQTLAASDLLLNVRSVPYLDVNADFYYAKSLEATTLGSMSYGISGDFIYEPSEVNVVFFNKELLKQAPLPDIYSLVDSNQWDMENFLLYSEEIYSLAQANGANVYGILSANSTNNLLNVFWAASGMPFMRNEYGQRPELVYNTDETRAFVERFGNLFFRSVSYSSANTQQSAVASFANGGGLFLIAPLSIAPQIVGRGVDWGIVPIPKTDINQAHYYSYMNKGYSLAGFTKGTDDLNLSGIITSAFFDCSKGLMQEFEVQTYLNLYFTSSTDARMMEKIIESPYFDPVEFIGQIESSYVASTQTVLYRAASNGTNFDALYNQSKKMLDKYLDTIF